MARGGCRVSRRGLSTETKLAERARGRKVVVWLRWWGSSRRIRQEPEGVGEMKER